jgi:hypothetical protein
VQPAPFVAACPAAAAAAGSADVHTEVGDAAPADTGRSLRPDTLPAAAGGDYTAEADAGSAAAAADEGAAAAADDDGAAAQPRPRRCGDIYKKNKIHIQPTNQPSNNSRATTTLGSKLKKKKKTYQLPNQIQFPTESSH